jgi:hypothetical protein
MNKFKMQKKLTWINGVNDEEGGFKLVYAVSNDEYMSYDFMQEEEAEKFTEKCNNAKDIKEFIDYFIKERSGKIIDH